MNKEQLMSQRAYFNMVHGITLRLIGTFEDKDLDFRATPNTRTVRDLIYHIYGFENTVVETMTAGEMTGDMLNACTPESDAGKMIASTIKTISDAQAYANKNHKAADDILATLSEQELSKQIQCPFGVFPAWDLFTMINDEHWHHRGQLYTYARLLGLEPPMLYDYK